jgi:hypothetical protein
MSNAYTPPASPRPTASRVPSGLNASASGPAENAVDPHRDDSLFLERPELPQAHGSTIGRHRDLVAGGEPARAFPPAPVADACFTHELVFQT